MSRQSLLIVYDGACPFCTAYVSLVKLREHFAVELLSARSADTRIDAFLRDGYRLDTGLLLKTDHAVYLGAEAMYQLAKISTGEDMLNRTQRILCSRQWLSTLLYPVLRFLRRCVLVIRRVPLIEAARSK